MANKIKYTAIGSFAVSDTISHLCSAYYLPADIDTAVQNFPTFKFDPVKDKEFFDSRAWTKPADEQMAETKKVLDRFNSWYPKANTMEKVLLGVSALTGSSEQIDNIVHDAFRSMQVNFRQEIVDAEGEFYYIDDLNAMRLEENLNAAIHTDQTEWWCRRFEEQVRRVSAMPTIPFKHFRAWNERHETEVKAMEIRIRRDRFIQYNLSIKQGRRIFNRSLRLFSSMFSENTARKFLKGKNLWIRGHYYMWKLKLDPRSIIADTLSPPIAHTPFEITICDHQCNKLADCCVLFVNTPVLDQAVGFGLSIANPEDELVLLRAANIFRFSELGLQNELLKSFPNAVSYPPYPPNPRLPIENDDWGNEYVPPVGCTTIDDGPMPESDEVSNEYRGYIPHYEPIPDGNPYGTSFGCELDDAIPPILSAANNQVLTEEQRMQTINLYKAWRIDSRIERYHNSIHPITSRLHDKLISKLDVDPNILHYMRFPEFRFFFLERLIDAPILEAYIGAKVPLYEWKL